MVAILDSIAPLILLIIAGLVGGSTGRLSETLKKGLTDYCFYFGMPALLARAIVTAPPNAIAAHMIWAAYLAPIAAVWLSVTLLGLFGGRAGIRQSPSVAMAATYGNVLMLGIPLAFSHFSPAAAPTIALLVLVHSPVLFLLAAAHAEITKLVKTPGAEPSMGLLKSIRELVLDLVTNPIILSIALAAVMRRADLSLPPLIDKSLSLLGQATLPCVLVSIGLGLSRFKLKGEAWTVSAICLLKLAAMPAGVWAISNYYLGLSPFETAVIALLAAMPTGANAYIFANRSGVAEDSVSGAVAVSTIISAATVPVVLLLIETKS